MPGKARRGIRVATRSRARQQRVKPWHSVTVLITPRPGVNLDNLSQNLAFLRSDVSNKVGSAHGAHKRLLAYLEWAGSAARLLGYQISEADLASLVFNRRYELLLASAGTLTSDEAQVQRVVNDLVTLEVEERGKDFDAAITTLEAYKDRWTNVSDLVVLDTNFYLHHPDKLEEADIATASGLGGTRAHVLVPMVVIDELDGLKQHSKQKVRWRAGYTVAVLDRVFMRGTVGRLHGDDNAPTADGLVGQGEVTMELLLDPPGHVRLPINDDEIVDRAVAVQTLAGREVTLVTYDTGMSTRARSAGLRAVKLAEDIGEEPK